MNEKDIEFDNSGGPVKIIRFKNKEYYKKQPGLPADSDNSDDKGKNSEESSRKKITGIIHQPNKENMITEPARAPYNFVPLNRQVIPSNGYETVSSFKGLNGYLDLEIKALSPLFIRGSAGFFCSKDGKPFIPGSSIRGMIKNLVNIVSYGKLDQYTNKVLYRRSTMNIDRDSIAKGFMSYKDGRYSIASAIVITQDSSDLANYPFSYSFTREDESCIFSTGMFNGRSKVWKFTKSSENSINVNKSTIESYESDSTRSKEAVDIIKSLQSGRIVDNNGTNIGNVAIPEKLGIPVFYRTSSTGIVSFGHAKYHRVPYTLTIGDHITQDPCIGLDFSESIFGTMKQSSKVFFEDFCLNGAGIFELNEPR
ncbi:MAG: RAMP superfamily CRISPR-associated protein, partial [Mariniphaga sp.]